MNEYSVWTAIIANAVFWFSLTIFGAAAVTSWAPQTVYRHSNVIFRERPFEQRLYKALRINRWKDRLPIYRHNEKIFDRRHLAKEISGDYLDAFIAETCKAEFVHLVLAIAGFSSAVFVPLMIEPWYAFLIVALAMCCAHMPFIMVQRHNRRRLLQLRGRVE